MLIMKVGDLLKKLRTDKDLSLDDVAKQLGLARQTLRSIVFAILLPLTWLVPELTSQ